MHMHILDPQEAAGQPEAFPVVPPPLEKEKDDFPSPRTPWERAEAFAQLMVPKEQ
jgi:hypothetical protein